MNNQYIAYKKFLIYLILIKAFSNFWNPALPF